MATVDIVIVVAFLAYALSSGFRARRAASQNLEEYFLAGRTLPGWKAGISMAATQFAADTPLLVTGLIATAGIFSLWRLWIYALAFLLLGFVLAASWRRAGVLTDAELTEIRYGDKPAAVLRGIKAVYFGTIFNCTVLAMVLLASKEIAEPFLPWHEWIPNGVFEPLLSFVEWLGMPLARPGGDPASVWVRSTDNVISIGAIVLVTTLYSTTGGLRSVVQTDVLQFFLMMLGTALYAGWVVHEAGGFQAITDRIAQMYAGGGPGGITPTEILAFEPSNAKNASFVVLAVFALQWLVQMNADGTGYLAQRSMACRSDGDAKIAAVVFTVAQIFLRSLLWLPIGLGLLVLFPPDLASTGGSLAAEREATFVLGIQELLPAGVKGLMLTGMLAALASTVDTHLNWGSSYWTNDIVKRFVFGSWLKREPSPRTLVWVARGANILILTIALLIMPRLSSIQVAWQASLLLGAGMGVMLILRWIWWRVSAWGEIACIVASLVLAPTLLVGLPGAESEALRLLLMAGGATLAGVVTSLVCGPEDPGRLDAFFARSAPPGFWGPVARRAGVEAGVGERRLWLGIGATGAAAASLFLMLTSLGSWMAGSPAPTWFPWRSWWIGLTLLAGIGLVPVWLKLGFGGRWIGGLLSRK